jgi:hypothetical protein
MDNFQRGEVRSMPIYVAGNVYVAGGDGGFDGSILKLQSELYDARLVGLRAHHAELRIPQADVWGVEMRGVGQVETIGAKL